MNKLILAIALVFVLAAGATTAVTIQPQPATAGCTGGSNC